MLLVWHPAHSLRADSAFYRSFCSLTGISQPGETATLQPATAGQPPLPPSRANCPLAVALLLDADSCSACFASMSPGPQELAVILQKLSSTGTGSLALSAPLAWREEAGTMGREMLTAALARFPRACVGLRPCTTALPEPAPAALAQYAIPAANVRGRTGGLPRANRALPTALADSPDALRFPWAADWDGQDIFTRVPESTEPRSMPLLMQWGPLVVPTLPLRLAMAHRGISPQQVTAELGRSITIGPLTLPLDDCGRVPLEGVHTRMLALTELLAADFRGTGSAPVILVQPAGGESAAERTRLLAETVSRLLDTPAPRPAQPAAPPGPVLRPFPFPRDFNTAFWAALLLCELMMLLAFLPRAWRAPLLGAIPATLLCAAHHLATQGLYLEITPFLVTWLLMAAVCTLPPIRRAKPGQGE